MRAIQHLFRRGAIHWWRRHAPKKAAESERVAIVISVQTSVLAMPRSIATRLSPSGRVLTDDDVVSLELASRVFAKSGGE